jgi:putative PIN family toxin of toxin-antitoxin system
LDPNVLISAAISPAGVTANILALVDAGSLTPIVSPALVGELREVLARPRFRRYLSDSLAEQFVSDLEGVGEWHDDPPQTPRVSIDPDDDYLVALALAAQADALVSGDPDLNTLTVPGVCVLSPRQLLDAVRSAS